jgi:lysophospholipase L1-like esterase
MHKKVSAAIISLIITATIPGCDQANSNGSGAAAAPSEKLTALREKYAEVPEASLILKHEKGSALYEELKQRYAANLETLNQEASAIGAKLVVVVLTPEVGVSVTSSTRTGTPYIKEVCNKNGIDVFDLSEKLGTYKPEEITQMPLDGHWSKRGAQVIAEELAPIISKYADAKSTATYQDDLRPELFGDLDANKNEILDGGKDLPYNLITNMQGLRMDYDLSFPKAKQRILFLGDSQIYSPFLDNKDITSNLLQQKFSDKEILNAGVIGYSVDDYASLLKEKAKYAEPDVIVLFTNPNDITDMYFTQRNRLGRNREGVDPSSSEVEFYNTVYSKK